MRIGEGEIDSVLKGVERVIVAKGKKKLDFNLKTDQPDREELLKHLMGPSGNLRAPTIRTGRIVLVGFSPDAYGEVFGG